MPNTPPPDPDAATIAQSLLERTGNGLMKDDFAIYRDCFILPQEFDTFEGRRRIVNEIQLKALFDSVRAHFAATHVTMFDRQIVAAAFVTESEIRYTHVSRLIVSGKVLQSSYPVMSVVRLTQSGWKVASASYAVPSGTGHERALRVGEVVAIP